jgi:hypothetical protein
VEAAPAHPVQRAQLVAAFPDDPPAHVADAAREAVEHGWITSVSDRGPHASGYFPPNRAGCTRPSDHGVTLTALLRERGGRVSRTDARAALGVSDRTLSRVLTTTAEAASDNRGGVILREP